MLKPKEIRYETCTFQGSRTGLGKRGTRSKGAGDDGSKEKVTKRRSDERVKGTVKETVLFLTNRLIFGYILFRTEAG